MGETFITHYSMNPACRDDHGVTRGEFYLDDFVDHVAQPRVVLQLGP